jgi:cytochrome c
MSSNLESNKIFAAILVAGITAMLGGFIARELVHPHMPETDAVAVEGAAVEGGASSGPAMPEPILNLIATADIAQGEKLSKACASCHSFDKGGPNKIGPGLWNVVGGSKAAHAGFAYSEGMKAKGGAWTYNDLNHFLWKPKSFVSDTKMTYVGLKKPEDRAALIAWLRTKADAPHAMPSAGEIEQEAKELAPPVAAEVFPAEGGVEGAAPTAKESDIKPADDKPVAAH